MYQVLVVGWNEGRDVLPISFARLVRQHCRAGLAEAKAMLDDFAEHGQVVIEFDEKGRATAFAEAVTSLGARCEVKEVA